MPPGQRRIVRGFLATASRALRTATRRVKAAHPGNKPSSVQRLLLAPSPDFALCYHDRKLVLTSVLLFLISFRHGHAACSSGSPVKEFVFSKLHSILC